MSLTHSHTNHDDNNNRQPCVMPNTRHVSLVQKLRWHVSGNISPTAFAIGDVDGHGVRRSSPSSASGNTRRKEQICERDFDG